MQSQALDPAVVPELGKYHLVAELARGGMGIIHLAVAHGLAGFNKLLVVKELKPELSRDESYVSMFLDEARLAARLEHRNIVQTIEVGSEGTRHYMVMEFLEGRSLYRIGRRFPQRGSFPLGGQLRVLAEALLGLHYAHELRDFDGEALGIVHRDVSPLNVFVTFDGQVKVIDFGIAKSVESTQETKTGVLKGRVAYMAPEQAWGSTVDRRADVYSAGVMVWEAAAGRRLWPGMNDVEILARLLREGPPSLRAVRPDVAPDLEAICARAMAKDADHRYATALDLLEDLETHLERRQDTMTMREVGALVGRAFAEERGKTNALIEDTLTRVRNGPRSGVMPAFEIRIPGTPSGAHILCEDPSHGSARLGLTPTSQAPTTGATPLGTGAGAPDGGSWWRSRRVAVPAVTAGAIVVLALGIVLAAAVRDREPGAGTAGIVAATAAEPAVGATGQAPDLVDLVVRVSPASAQITVDGAPTPSNPFHGRFSRDGQVHHVMAFADGYDPKIEDVSFAGDVSVDVSLDRHSSPPPRYVPPPPPPHATRRGGGQAPAPSPPAPAETAAPAPPARTDVGPAGGHAPLRPITTSNPYGTP